MSELDAVWSWMKDNKWLTAVVVIVLLLLVGTTSLWANTFGSQLQDQAAESLQQSFDARSGGGGAGEFVEVQEADIDIESDDADTTSSEIRETMQGSDGYIERSSRNVNDLYLTIHLTARVPSDRFSAFVDEMRSTYDVESYTVRNFRLPIQRELDELEIINRTLRDLEDIREQVRTMEAGGEKAELLVTLTEKELEVKRQQRELERELSDTQQQSDMATVNFRIQQRRAVEVLPENLGNRFLNEVKESLDDIVNALITTVTGGVEALFQAVKAVVYVIAFAIPFFFAYLGLRRLYRKYNE